MSSECATRFVRVEYDDRESMPWFVVFGENNLVCMFDEREAAESWAEQLRELCDAFHEFARCNDGS